MTRKLYTAALHAAVRGYSHHANSTGSSLGQAWLQPLEIVPPSSEGDTLDFD